MKLSEKAILDFQQIFQAKLGILLSAEEAESRALELMSFFSLIYIPISKKDSDILETYQNTEN